MLHRVAGLDEVPMETANSKRNLYKYAGSSWQGVVLDNELVFIVREHPMIGRCLFCAVQRTSSDQDEGCLSLCCFLMWLISVFLLSLTPPPWYIHGSIKVPVGGDQGRISGVFIYHSLYYYLRTRPLIELGGSVRSGG